MKLPLPLRRARRRLMFLSLLALLRVVGFARARTVGHWLGELQFRFAWQSRRRLQSEVAQVLGRPHNGASVQALLREAYRVNNGALLEIMAMFDRRQNEDMLVARCRLDGLEHLRAAMAEGRGAIVLATHMGNATLAMIRLAQAGWPVTLVYRKARMMSAGFFESGLAHYGIQGILANGGLRAYGQMLSNLKKGRVVVVMMDQGVQKAADGVRLRFLGKDMPMTAGPAQLARASRAPVLPLVALAATPLWHFTLEAPLAMNHESLQADVEFLVGVTERQVLRAPQLWSWHHRRWCKFPMTPAA